MDKKIKALRAKYKGMIDYGPFMDRIRSGKYDGFNGLNQFRHDVPRYFGHPGDALDDALNKHDRLGERERMEAALKDYRELQGKRVEEINRKERERCKKANKLGQEHGRLGRYNPPYEVSQDSTVKRSYDLGYLSTEKK